MAYLFVTVWAAIFMIATLVSSFMSVAVLFSPWPWASLVLLPVTGILYCIAHWLVNWSDDLY
jgi:hypothetical protein